MLNQPKIENRADQRYVGVRVVMPMSEFDRKITAMTEEVTKWLIVNDIQASGRLFLRYHVIDMPDRMDVELGIPVNRAHEAGGEVKNSELPEGRYAVLSYKGVKNGIQANKALIDWIEEQKEEAVCHSSENGEAFKARYETFLTDPKAKPNQDNWETEIAIKLRD